jgi:hypothetical protein
MNASGWRDRSDCRHEEKMELRKQTDILLR